MIRFGPYEADLNTLEPSRSDIRLRLQDKPLAVLALLLERAGEVVTRQELKERLWQGVGSAGFDSCLNNAVRKVRRALGDSAATPKWVETVPRVGYRFRGLAREQRRAGALRSGKRRPTAAGDGRACPCIGCSEPFPIGGMAGRYRILSKLGKGGMGVVLKAEDVRIGRLAALKFVSHDRLDSEAVVERLVREAQAAGAIDHPNVCPIYGIEEEAGRTFIAMAYIEGRSLADRIAERGLSLEEALDVACQIAEGLRAAHSKGVVHRDLKPQNILITPEGRVKILDFGLASVAGRARITKEGATLGTTSYMSPEQLEAAAVDGRADLWGLGVILYEMLAQHLPFEGLYEPVIAYEIMNEAPTPLTRRRPGLPPPIDRVIARALAKERAQRYSSATEFLTDLQGLRAGESVGCPAPIKDDGGGKSSHRLAVGLVLTAVCLLLALLLELGLVG